MPPSPTASLAASRRSRPRLTWLDVLFCLTCLISQVLALTAEQPRPTETLLLDTSVPYLEDGVWTMLSQHEHNLKRRKVARNAAHTKTATATSPPSSIPAPSSTPDSSSNSGSSSDVSVHTSTTTAPPRPLPSPFDSSLSSNFTTSSCPAFINSFLLSPTFKDCYPFSMLLQTSRGFFDAEKALVTITQVLDATCSANVSTCSAYFSSLATNLTDSSNCGPDYDLGNSVVVQAYLAMVSYQVLYTATCLKDAQSSTYCFAEAVTNLTTPSNVYVYFLPYNISFPGSSVPTCNFCLQQTMDVLQSAAADRSQAIAYTYQSAAQQIDTICGPDFVNQTLPRAMSNATTVVKPPGGLMWLMTALSLALAAWQCLA